MVDIAGIVAGHEKRLAALDPLLPLTHPLPPIGADEPALATDGGIGYARRDRNGPGSLLRVYQPTDLHRLVARIDDTRPAAAMADLLTGWATQVHSVVTRDAGDRPAEASPTDDGATVVWPSRDTALTRVFLDHGLVPLATVAARPAGRAGPEPGTRTTIREITAADLDAIVDLYLQEIAWDAHFGGVTERPDAADIIRDAYVYEVTQDQLWTWVAEVDGRPAALLSVSPPQHAGWVAPFTRVEPVAHVAVGVVAVRHRGGGLGSALVAHAHRVLDAAGIGATLLHYSSLNPLSGPFWHRCGYRPLWTFWEARPAGQLKTRR
jgi:GNAT superfamily N-acetyltransferase